MRVTGWVVAGVPLVIAAVRVVATGTDVRFAWLALTSTAAAAAMLALVRRGTPPSRSPAVHAAFAVLAAAGATGVTAFALGAGSAPALLSVALGFALASGVGLALVAAPRAV